MGEIILPYSNHAIIPIEDLINHFSKNKINYMIIGATHSKLENHPKPYSLDVWIRKHPNVDGNENTCQEAREVINQIIRHKQFSKAIRMNPETGRMCKALVFCSCK